MNDIVWHLLSVAGEHSIDVQWTTKLDPFTPPACRLDTRIVLMNMLWHRPIEIPFQLAHEISHILNGDPEDEFFYHATYTGRRSVEYKANVGAVKLLVPLYCDEVDQQDANSVAFEELFAIPHFLHSKVKDEINQYYVQP